jgi:cystathionine gamma-synthase
MRETYEDFYFDEDALFMERNSRDFARRILDINTRTEAVCDLLRVRSRAGGCAGAAVVDVLYPKWAHRALYDACRVRAPGAAEGGFGGLFSLTFGSLAASRAFFDALPCHKGPSLGTNFTLACPYTVLAHFAEMDWAAKFGVEEGLVRVSVGLEPTQTLLDGFTAALEAAERAHAANGSSA